MKHVSLILISLFLMTSCSGDGESFGSGSDGDGAGTGQGNGNDTIAGQITAGEWRDLDSWDFWVGLMQDETFSQTQGYWGFHTNNRLAFRISDSNSSPFNGALITVLKDGVVEAEVKTDNFGRANVFINLNHRNDDTINLSNYSMEVNSIPIMQELLPFSQGVNEVSIQNLNPISDVIQVSFIVDATGSMGDEMEFLKSDLQDVISRVQNENQSTSIQTSAMFYRDYGDAYVVQHSGFTQNLNTTTNYIQQQSADGGGDYPEAVDVALHTAINELQWSANSKTKIAFLLLDAPPHYETQVIQSIQQSVMQAARNGIKIIPITASGIDKQTEFLMRFLAISTNGTYVFITNDSGIGNDHIEPTVGDYQVEFLNDLMVRLINTYSE